MQANMDALSRYRWLVDWSRRVLKDPEDVQAISAEVSHAKPVPSMDSVVG